MGVKAFGFRELEKSMTAAAQVLADENLLRDVMHEAAQPVAQRMVELVAKDTGLTADDIRVDDEPSAAGVARIAIGGSRKKHGRAFIMSFLEYGTVKKGARPFMRPAWDSERENFFRAIGRALKERLRPAMKGAA